MTLNPLVTIITPVYNGGELLKETIDSVLGQAYSNIEYIIVDGKSTDNTLDIVSSYKNEITELISEPDTGMYDALAKGLGRAKGKIICYINAGDLLFPHAIKLVADIFRNQNLFWLTGYRTICNEQGEITHVDLPFRYKSSLIRTGSYGRALPFIQQESTFWRASLMDAVDLNYLRNLKMAGDYYLWWCFSRKVNLEIIASQLGVFRKHSGQISERLGQYYSEIELFAKKRDIADRISEKYELMFWALHPKLREIFNKTVIKFNHQTRCWE